MWDYRVAFASKEQSYKDVKWVAVDTDAIEADIKAFSNSLKAYGNENSVVKGWKAWQSLEESIKVWQKVLPLIAELRADSMRARHWKALQFLTRTFCKFDLVEKHTSSDFKLGDLVDLQLTSVQEGVEDIIETANKELKIEKSMARIEMTWAGLELNYALHGETEVSVIRPSEELMENLDAHQLELQGMIGMGKFVEHFKDSVLHYQRTLGTVESVLKVWLSVTRGWVSLESIFLSSEDIRSQLPEDTKRFENVHSEFTDLMGMASTEPNAVNVCCVEGREESLVAMNKALELCQKSLNDYLDVKKTIFPRFYFLSNPALLQILSNGNDPPKIMPFLSDCFGVLSDLTFEAGSENRTTHMHAADGEIIPFENVFEISGEVEQWLNKLQDKMRDTLRWQMNLGIDAAVSWDVDKPRHEWLKDFPAQIVLNSCQIFWTDEAESALQVIEGGDEDAFKNYLTKCNERLDNLIQLVLGKLEKPLRRKIIALITLDVHGRDVIDKLIKQKAESPQDFLWSQQLRFYWQSDNYDVNIKICDFRGKYFYDYIGNTGRLVITPLTDRCYITLTTALRLFLGAAPAGPAGTGKTETTKDLARALANPIYVFNCSDQMTYQSMADLFRGLCQVGAWGCFDEFNRIQLEVLSVIATQVKTIQESIVFLSVPANREAKYQGAPPRTPPVKVGMFDFMGTRISLVPTTGYFITMNPGYAGRG